MGHRVPGYRHLPPRGRAAASEWPCAGRAHPVQRYPGDRNQCSANQRRASTHTASGVKPARPASC